MFGLTSKVGQSAKQTAAAQQLQPGDVIVVSARSLVMVLLMWWPDYFRRYPHYHQWNHVAVFHHTDAAGTQWCYEAAPGGVAKRNVATLGRVMANVDQPKTDAQRTQVADLAEAMFKTPYDWDAIEQNAFTKLGEHGVSWSMEWDGARPPVHVICSSYSAYLYWMAHLSGPHSWLTTPADWAEFIAERGWENPQAPPHPAAAKAGG